MMARMRAVSLLRPVFKYVSFVPATDSEFQRLRTILNIRGEYRGISGASSLRNRLTSYLTSCIILDQMRFSEDEVAITGRESAL